MPSPIRLDTVANLIEHDHVLALFCPRCQRWSDAPLAMLAARGHGDTPIRRLRFHCRDCASAAERQLRPPHPGRSNAVGWPAPSPAF
jgi:hypothetical protein